MIWTQEEAESQHSVSPRLAELLPKYLPVSSPVVDYGCGRGFYVSKLRESGFEVIGVEGTPEINEIGIVKDILVADLSKPLSLKLLPSTTLCLEVAEHIEPKFETIFLDNILKYCSGRLILSWATPNQGGHGHVNELDNITVILKLKKRGLKLDFEATQRLRTEMRGDKCWWFQNTLFIFDL
jgi:hypothetical protein